MPATLNEPLPVDEPQAIHDPPPPNPVFDDSNIKAMAEKFKKNWAQAPADGKVGSGNAAPVSDPASDKSSSAAKPEPGKDPAVIPGKPAVQPGGTEDEPDIAPTEPLNRERWKKLYQSKESHKAAAAALKAEKESLAQKAAALEADLAKTKAALPPNLEEVQKALADSTRIAEENKRLTETIEAVNFEKSPRFQNWWNSETAKHIKVGQSHIPPAQREEFAKLLMAPASPERNAALDAIIEPLPATSKRLATGALEQIESLKIQREEALTRGSEKWKELQAHEKAEADRNSAARATALQQAGDEAVKRAKLLSAFQPTGDAAKDAEIPSREAFVRAVVAGKIDSDMMLNIPAAAVEMLHLQDTVIPSLKAEIAKRDELIKQLQGTSPRAGDGRGSASRAAEEKGAKEGTSFAERVKSLMSK